MVYKGRTVHSLDIQLQRGLTKLAKKIYKKFISRTSLKVGQAYLLTRTGKKRIRFSSVYVPSL